MPRLPDAERELTLAMKDETTRAIAMRELSDLLTAKGSSKLSPGNWIAPAEAIRRVQASAPVGAPGVFVIHVQASGLVDGTLYLNSEPNYRDQRNVSVAISSGAASSLADTLGADPQIALKGKKMLVTGVARQVTIMIHKPGQPPGAFYYQTHIVVTDADQIEVIDKR